MQAVTSVQRDAPVHPPGAIAFAAGALWITHDARTRM